MEDDIKRVEEEIRNDPDPLRDHRKRSRAPEGVIVGSPEYWKWWREENKLKNRLYQRRSYLRRRKVILALQKHEEGEAENIEAALREVDEAIASLSLLRNSQVAETRIKLKASAENMDKEAAVLEVPFIREMADKYGVTYVEAKRIMTADDYKGDESFTNEMNSRLEDILNMTRKESG
jgi:altronate dehydratase